ncbi:hypothetical protein HELRODRAFT_77289, partial [Helobdella robusta]|uniref:Uncharacterized protein n=1 Tax=Helobdella robusta TaxID=6412 RepID=T1G2V9_HELRO
VLILAMTSGQMWNHIRGAQLMLRNPQDGQWVGTPCCCCCGCCCYYCCGCCCCCFCGFHISFLLFPSLR